MPRPPDNPHIPEQAMQGLSQAAAMVPEGVILSTLRKAPVKVGSPIAGVRALEPASESTVSSGSERHVDPRRPMP